MHVRLLIGGCNLQAGHSLTNPNLTENDKKRWRPKPCRTRRSCHAGLKPQQWAVMVALDDSGGHSLASQYEQTGAPSPPLGH